MARHLKIAAAEALAKLAREDVPDEVHTASTGRRLTFGADYIIPNAFDPRLISWIPPAVARAAMDSGVARKPLIDLHKRLRQHQPALPRAGRSGRFNGRRRLPKRARLVSGRLYQSCAGTRRQPHAQSR